MAGFGQVGVPGASALMDRSASLSDQVAGETEQQRKKRLAALQQNRMLPGPSDFLNGGYGAALGSQ